MLAKKESELIKQFMGMYECACVWVHTHVYIQSETVGQIEK